MSDVINLVLSLRKQNITDKSEQCHIGFPIHCGQDKANEIAIREKATELLRFALSTKWKLE